MLDIAQEPLTPSILKEFHKILKSSTSDSRKQWFNVGEYKTRPNVVGGIKTTPPGKVATEVDRLIANYNSKTQNSFEDIIDFHYKFELIHPFQDGNGRVGRIVLFKECLKNNITPFIIDHEHKLFYYRGLKEYATESGYLIGTCQSAQDAYQAMLDYFYPAN
jgi:Fic family protein